MQDIVEKYIALRDAKAAVSAQYKEKLAKFDLVLDKMEAHLLGEFNKLGIDSIGCDAGTAYKSTRSSASVADWDATLDYIRTNELWNMLERRVAKKAVEEFRDEHGDLPPGLNWREEVTINVRRS